MAEQRQALRDDLGRKEGAHILNIMRWADSIRVNRNDIVQGAEELGVPLDDHIAFCIAAMQKNAEALELAGTGASVAGEVS